MNTSDSRYIESREVNQTLAVTLNNYLESESDNSLSSLTLPTEHSRPIASPLVGHYLAKGTGADAGQMCEDGHHTLHRGTLS